MAFDISTATPIQQSPAGGFDLSTAQPVGDVANQQMTQQPPQAGDEQLASAVDNAMQGKGLGTLAEFAAGVNRTIFGALDFLGPDNINAILDIAGSDSRVPTLTETFGAEAGQFDPSLLGKMAGGAGEFAAAGLGAGAALRQGAKVLPKLAGAGESAAAGVLRQMGNTTAAADVGLGAVSGAGSEAGREIGGETGAMAGALAAPLAAVTAPTAIKSLFQYQTPAKQAISKLLQEGSPSTETLGYKLSQLPAKQDTSSAIGGRPASRAVKFKQELDAAKQGFDEGVLTAVKSSNPLDKKAMLKMVNIAQTGKSNAKYRASNRASDVAGQSLLGRVKAVRAINKKAGQDVEKAASSLKGQEVDLTSVESRFIDSLNKIGVKVTDDLKLDFKGSDLEGEKQSIKALNNVMDRMVNTDVPDAYGLHRLKGLIDTKVSFDKSGKGLKAKTERILKDLRSSVNETLGDQFPNYKAANKTYSDTIGALNDLQKAVGPSIDMLSPSGDKALGTSLRSLMSNVKSRGKMMDSIVELENTAARYGKRFDDDLLTQTLFADELDRMFGAAASTSLKGQQSQAMQTGIEAAQGNAAGAARAAAKGLFGRAKNINEKNAFKAIRNLLKEGAE